MSWIIRIVFAYVGLKLLGIIGLIGGLVAAHFLVKGVITQKQRLDPELRQQIEAALFNAAFPLMGYLAKADGRVSEEEIQAAEALMARMQLSAQQRKEAIALFKGGSKPEFTPEPLIGHFMQVCGQYSDVKQILLSYLIAIALADGEVDSREQQSLQDIAKQLGFSRFMFEQLMKMAQAQSQFRGGQYHQQGGGDAQSPQAVLDQAYEALGAAPSYTDAQLKKAYRKLMSQYHPDKLAGQGVPDEMLKVATERSQEIQTAYEIVKQSRKYQ